MFADRVREFVGIVFIQLCEDIIEEIQESLLCIALYPVSEYLHELEEEHFVFSTRQKVGRLMCLISLSYEQCPVIQMWTSKGAR